MLATRVGAGGKAWRAYLSTQARPGQPAVNARDRIGTGPWYNAKERIPDYLGRRLQRPIIQSEIHGDTLDEARRGSNLTKEFAVTEKGELVNGIGDPLPTRHDLLTGSQPDGRAFTDAALVEARVERGAVVGYRDEVSTHWAVGLRVLRGEADAGVATRAVASALSLGFVPLAPERFDLVVPKETYFRPPVQALIEAIRSERFRREVERLGGYDWTRTGRVVGEVG